MLGPQDSHNGTTHIAAGVAIGSVVSTRLCVADVGRSMRGCNMMRMGGDLPTSGSPGLASSGRPIPPPRRTNFYHRLPARLSGDKDDAAVYFSVRAICSCAAAMSSSSTFHYMGVTPRDHGAYIVITAVVGVTWTVLVYCIRLYIRLNFNGPFGFDDASASFATVSARDRRFGLRISNLMRGTYRSLALCSLR